MNTVQTIGEKLAALRTHLASYDKLAVAFSGGVDSTFLLAVAHEVLGKNTLALTAASPAFPLREHQEALDFCTSRGIAQIVFDADQFSIEGFAENPPERCYLCKKGLFTSMLNKAAEAGYTVLADGSNTDDLSDYRPGHQALAELHIVSPLVEYGFSKADVRAASELLGLATAQKPSFACLATRFPYGSHISPEGLARVDAAEQYLIDLGASQVRARSIGDEARIEVLPAELPLVMENRVQIIAQLKDYGFTYVALDLEGYRSGSMNETISPA